MNSIVNVFTNIRNNVLSGKRQFIQKYHSKFILRVLDKMVENGYLEKVETFVPGSANKGSKIRWVRITISPTLNRCGAVTPQFSTKHADIEQKERQFLPANNIGILIFSTTDGLKTNVEIRENGLILGGKIIGYVY
jgi:small subunit ribosomal protein S8